MVRIGENRDILDQKKRSIRGHKKKNQHADRQEWAKHWILKKKEHKRLKGKKCAGEIRIRKTLNSLHHGQARWNKNGWNQHMINCQTAKKYQCCSQTIMFQGHPTAALPTTFCSVTCTVSTTTICFKHLAQLMCSDSVCYCKLVFFLLQYFPMK